MGNMLCLSLFLFVNWHNTATPSMFQPKDSLAEELGINTRQMADVLIRFLEEFESSQRAPWQRFRSLGLWFQKGVQKDDGLCIVSREPWI